MNPSTRMFIVLEGINGCGKSTVAGRLQDLISEAGYRCVIYRDPGETPAGERIRTIVKDPKIQLDPWTQVLLYTAARYELGLVALRRLNMGTVVIADRWWPSTYAYQGAQGAPGKWIRDLNKYMTPPGGKMLAARSFFLDVLPVLALERSGAVRPCGVDAGGDRFEIKGLEFARYLRDRYMELVRSGELTRIEVGSNSASSVAQNIWDGYLKDQFKRKG